MSLDASMEASALRETDGALRELVKVGKTIGLRKASIAMMLRAVADELDPPSILIAGTDTRQ